MSINSWLSSLALLTVVVGVVYDFAVHRLPNGLTVTSALVALVLQAWLQGWPGFFDGATGLLAAMALFFPLYLARWMGAGDIKLLMAVGACLGWRLGLLTNALTLGIGSLAAFGILAFRGGLWRYLRRYGRMTRCLLFTGQWVYIPPERNDPSTIRFPYALVIAIGTVAALFCHRELAAWRAHLATG